MGFWQNTRALRRDSQRLRKKEEDIYNAIKEQPDLVPVSKKLATRSIMFSLLSMLTVVVAIVGVYLAVTKFFVEHFFVTLISLIIGGAILVYAFVLFIIKAITCLIYQFKLNKKSHTWVALALVILPAIILVVGIIIVAAASVGT